MSANILLKKSKVDSPWIYDFFSLRLSNHLVSTPLSVSPLVLQNTAYKACSTGACITKLGLSNACQYDQEGNIYENIIFPFRIEFSPTPYVHQDWRKPDTLQDWLNNLASIPKGGKLYTIRGYENPNDKVGVNLGEMITTEDCTTSYFGDTRLAFKHQRVDEDIALRPEWHDALQTDCICNGIEKK